MSKNYKLIPFDLEKAKNGAEIVVKYDGYNTYNSIKILTFDRFEGVKNKMGWDLNLSILAIDLINGAILKCFNDEGGRAYSELDIKGFLYIKEQPKYRPFQYGDKIPLDAKVINKYSNLKYGINNFRLTKNSTEISCYDFQFDRSDFHDSNFLLKHYTFEDGSPCGVLED